MTLFPGLYECIVNHALEDLLSKAQEDHIEVSLATMDEGESHILLAQYMAGMIAQSLKKIKGKNKILNQIQICNSIIKQLYEKSLQIECRNETITNAAKRLLEVRNPLVQATPRPDTPLSFGCLLTGTRNDPTLVSQLQKEILHADRIDILCSFIKWSGIRILQDELKAFAERPDTLLRVITTSYLGATDLKAVEFLRSLPNAELRITYDTKRTRLHAKAYIYYRNTGFGTAYIGSANLSQAALTEGLEWNVKISQYESPHLWEKICATFETYANHAEFETYSKKDKTRLSQALIAEREGLSNRGYEEGGVTFFDITPYEYQKEILEKLEADRKIHSRFRNLVVAATGTGKTVVAAFDYKQVCQVHESSKRYVRMLFVAHRKEILRQSRTCFRGILKDQNFGELFVGEFRPDHFEQLFVSIQLFNSRSLWEKIPADYYDYIVIDEFHHAAANSYRHLLQYFKPRILLGLTATPERADGLDVLGFFDDYIAAEIRLPDAINKKLLCPFQYFGITDSVSYNQITWTRGGYDIREIDNLLTGNDMRAMLVIKKLKEILLDVRLARGLCFCVSQGHAQYMAQKLSEAGIPSMALTADSLLDVRNNAQNRIVQREINFICVVDLFNEGVDIPEIDTVVFLRPTESLTIFLQQLGRGLRIFNGKECLTVLDFVGQAHQNYDFEMRFRSLIGRTRKRVDDEIENGFSHLPAGCFIKLEKVAKEHILNNIRHALTHAKKTLYMRRIASFQADTGHRLSLANFLEYYSLEADEIYRRSNWSRLCTSANMRVDFFDPDEARLTKGFCRILNMNCSSQIEKLINILNRPFNAQEIDELDKRLLIMLNFSLWGLKSISKTLTGGMDRLYNNPVMHKELIELLNYLLMKVAIVTHRPNLPFFCPLEIHGNYTRDEILSGLGLWTFERQLSMREGVRHFPELKADLFFVTLNKTETDYSPTTMYDDYAISDTLFHWQSQNTTSADSPTGQRYISHEKTGQTILLFVRENKKQRGLSCPYYFLGPVDYVMHSGSRPMNITWRLRTAMPSFLLRQTARLATA